MSQPPAESSPILPPPAQGSPQPGQPYAAGQPYPPPGYPAYVPYQAPYNTYAILSLVLGVAVLPPLGIFFGYKARRQIAQTGEQGAELATAGIVVGWILTGIMGTFLLIWLGMVLFLFGGMAAGSAT